MDNDADSSTINLYGILGTVEGGNVHPSIQTAHSKRTVEHSLLEPQKSRVTSRGEPMNHPRESIIVFPFHTKYSLCTSPKELIFLVNTHLLCQINVRVLPISMNSDMTKSVPSLFLGLIVQGIIGVQPGKQEYATD